MTDGAHSSYRASGCISPHPRSMKDVPDEILGEIMLQYVQEVREQYTNAARDDYSQRPYSWLYIAHVSHRWREVALQYPRLWDWIPPMSPACTAASIERSGQRPLTIPLRRIPEQDLLVGQIPELEGEFWTGIFPSTSPAQQTMEESLRLLFQHLPRIEHMDIPANAPVPNLVDGKTALVLRSLTIRNSKTRDIPILSYLNALLRDALPALSELHSWCNPARMRNLLRPTLTSLTLSGQAVQRCDKNIVLDILQSMSALEDLRFDHADRVFEEDGFEDLFSTPAVSLSQISPDRSVELPSLRSIFISEHNGGRSAVCMLRHLILPKSVFIEVASYAGLPAVSSEVTDALLQTVHHLGGAENPLAMAVRSFNGQDIALQLWSDGPQTTEYVRFADWGKPRLSYIVRLPELAAADFGLRSFATRVTTLYVDHEMLASAWIRSCADMNQLQRLHIGGTAMYFVADALAAHVSRAAAKDNRLVPSLEMLVLDNVPWNVDFDHVQRDVPSPLTRNLATALRERGGINKVVIRGGIYLSYADARHLSTSGRVGGIDWDGAVTLEGGRTFEGFGPVACHGQVNSARM